MLPTETDFEAKVSMETEAVPVPEDPPLHILFIGDFSGRKNGKAAGGEVSAFGKPISVDRDNFDEVMRSLSPRLRIDPADRGTGPVFIRFNSLDDFHPDSIFTNVPFFGELRDIRRRLLDPDEFDSAAREVRGWTEGESAPVADEQPETTASEPVAGGEDLLEDILGHTKRSATAYSTETTDKTALSAFVSKLVRPYLLSTDEAEQEKLVSIVDSVTGDLMKGIVHHPDFRELEAAWRALNLVTRGVETGTELKLFVLDIGKDELTGDLKQVNDLTDSAYFRIVADGGTDADGGHVPWGMICANFNFELRVDDVAALIRLGKISGAVRAPFVSHIRPQMLGISSLAEAPAPANWNLRDATEEGKLWTTLRTVPEAANIGLAMPRFLARLPYGRETDPTEAFDYEELGDERRHDDYLWANPAFICGMLLAQSFVRSGWEIGGRYELDVNGLPAHIYTEDGETNTKPCAEIEMTHEACDILIEQGIMPLISFKNTDRVRLGGFHSVAFPQKALNGRWS